MDAGLIRYADDVLILSNLREQLLKIYLSLNMGKTRITEARKGIDFLSFPFFGKYDIRKEKNAARFFPSVSAPCHFRRKVSIIVNRKRAPYIVRNSL